MQDNIDVKLLSGNFKKNFFHFALVRNVSKITFVFMGVRNFTMHFQHRCKMMYTLITPK